MGDTKTGLHYTDEHTELLEENSVINNNFKEKFKPPSWLEDTETPYSWLQSLSRVLMLNVATSCGMKPHLNHGTFNDELEDYAALLRITCLRQIENLCDSDNNSEDVNEISSDNNCENITEESERRIQYEPEEAYLKCKAVLEEMASREGDVVYTRIGPALEHMLQATRANMLYFQGDVAGSQEIARNLKPVDEMSSENKAAFEGIKAKFIFQIYIDEREALAACMKAIHLDPNFCTWNFMCGIVRRRLRNNGKEDLPRGELEYFEKAVELASTPKHLLFLGQAYQELSSHFQTTPMEAESFLKTAVCLYRECWRIKTDINVSYISKRIGRGLLKMDSRFQDLQFAKECLFMSNEHKPTSMTFHHLGKYYYKHEMDDEKALEFFEKAGSWFGIGETIRLKLIKEENYDPYKEIQVLELLAPKKRQFDKYYSLIGWYYLVYKKDLYLAIRYFWNILRRDCSPLILMEFWCYTFCVKGPLNMIEVLVNEVMLFKEKHKILPPEEKHVGELFDSFLEKIYEKHPDLRELRPRFNLLGNLRNKCQQEIMFLRKKRYGFTFKNNRVPADNRSLSYQHQVSERSNTQKMGSECEASAGLENAGQIERSQKVNNPTWEIKHGAIRRLVVDQCVLKNEDNINTNNESTRDRQLPEAGTSHEGMNNCKVANQNYDLNNVNKSSKDETNNINGTSRPHEERERSYSQSRGGRGNERRQYNANSNRYDLTITDWRQENKYRNK